MKYVLISLIVIMCAAMQVAAQAEGQPARLPDSVMREVVSRVLRFYFKPEQDVRRVYVSNVKANWLPKIKNVGFTIVPASDGVVWSNVYVLTDVLREYRGYSVGFGRNRTDCSVTGDTWYFQAPFRKPPVKFKTGRGTFMGNGTDTCKSLPVATF